MMFIFLDHGQKRSFNAILVNFPEGDIELTGVNGSKIRIKTQDLVGVSWGNF